jgi:hypothetical protein
MHLTGGKLAIYLPRFLLPPPLEDSIFDYLYSSVLR